MKATSRFLSLLFLMGCANKTETNIITTYDLEIKTDIPASISINQKKNLIVSIAFDGVVKADVYSLSFEKKQGEFELYYEDNPFDLAQKIDFKGSEIENYTLTLPLAIKPLGRGKNELILAINSGGKQTHSKSIVFEAKYIPFSVQMNPALKQIRPNYEGIINIALNTDIKTLSRKLILQTPTSSTRLFTIKPTFNQSLGKVYLKNEHSTNFLALELDSEQAFKVPSGANRLYYITQTEGKKTLTFTVSDDAGQTQNIETEFEVSHIDYTPMVRQVTTSTKVLDTIEFVASVLAVDLPDINYSYSVDFGENITVHNGGHWLNAQKEPLAMKTAYTIDSDQNQTLYFVGEQVTVVPTRFLFKDSNNQAKKLELNIDVQKREFGLTALMVKSTDIFLGEIVPIEYQLKSEIKGGQSLDYGYQIQYSHSSATELGKLYFDRALTQAVKPLTPYAQVVNQSDTLYFFSESVIDEPIVINLEYRDKYTLFSGKKSRELYQKRKTYTVATPSRTETTEKINVGQIVPIQLRLNTAVGQEKYYRYQFKYSFEQNAELGKLYGQLTSDGKLEEEIILNDYTSIEANQNTLVYYVPKKVTNQDETATLKFEYEDNFNHRLSNNISFTIQTLDFDIQIPKVMYLGVVDSIQIVNKNYSKGQEFQFKFEYHNLSAGLKGFIFYDNNKRENEMWIEKEWYDIEPNAKLYIFGNNSYSYHLNIVFKEKNSGIVMTKSEPYRFDFEQQYQSEALTQTWTKTNCPVGTVGKGYEIVVSEGTFRANTQLQANTLRDDYISTLQNHIENGTNYTNAQNPNLNFTYTQTNHCVIASANNTRIQVTNPDLTNEIGRQYWHRSIAKRDFKVFIKENSFTSTTVSNANEKANNFFQSRGGGILNSTFYSSATTDIKSPENVTVIYQYKADDGQWKEQEIYPLREAKNELDFSKRYQVLTYYPKHKSMPPIGAYKNNCGGNDGDYYYFNSAGAGGHNTMGQYANEIEEVGEANAIVSSKVTYYQIPVQSETDMKNLANDEKLWATTLEEANKRYIGYWSGNREQPIWSGEARRIVNEKNSVEDKNKYCLKVKKYWASYKALTVIKSNCSILNDANWVYSNDKNTRTKKTYSGKNWTGNTNDNRVNKSSWVSWESQAKANALRDSEDSNGLKVQLQTLIDQTQYNNTYCEVSNTITEYGNSKQIIQSNVIYYTHTTWSCASGKEPKEKFKFTKDIVVLPNKIYHSDQNEANYQAKNRQDFRIDENIRQEKIYSYSRPADCDQG